MSDSRSTFSDLIVYVDESGDHGPVSPEFPVFVLAFCIFDKAEYANEVTTLMHGLKFEHFGHDTVVLHEREIRKSLPPFSFLLNEQRRLEFMEDITSLVARCPFTLVAAVIDKRKLREQPSVDADPYQLALGFGLQELALHRETLGDKGLLHVVFEGRGKKEDADLELAFRRVCDVNSLGRHLDMEPLFTHKQANHCGHQLADLVAVHRCPHALASAGESCFRGAGDEAPAVASGHGGWAAGFPDAPYNITPRRTPRRAADRVFPVRCG